MRRSIVCAVALAVAATGRAAAEPSSVQLGEPGPGAAIDRVRLALRPHAAALGATLTLSLSTTSTAPLELVLPLAVPRGTDVTALTITLDGARIHAAVRPADTARAGYAQTVRELRDPALLAWTSSTATHDHLELRVFPVARGHGAAVVVTLALPPTERLAIDPGGAAIGQIEIAGVGRARRVARPRQPVSVALPEPRAPDAWSDAALLRRPGVGPATSLFADAPDPARRRPLVIGCVLASDDDHDRVRSLTPTEIRRLVRLHHPQLRTCYQRAAQRDHTLAGEAILRFAITAAGAVGAVEIDGTLRDLDATACLAREVATWRFREGPGVTAVRYPLRFLAVTVSDPAARRAATRRLVDGAPRTAYDQLMRTALIVLALGLGACGDTAWILPEADAIAIADAELASRGLTADDRGHTVATSLVTLQLDGWSATAKLGFEYVGDPDPELGAASPYADLVGAEELQAAVDAAVGADTHVLVIHTWAHETEALCRDQYLRALQARLDALAP